MKAFDQLWAHFKPHESKAERRLVLKLDFFILTFCCLAYFTCVLDAYMRDLRRDIPQVLGKNFKTMDHC